MSKDGGSAFPVIGFDTRGGQGFDSIYSNGMSLRDWFAGMAMQGMITATAMHGVGSEEKWSNAAYDIADAMLKARQNTRTNEKMEP